jgi:hypothetical protein
MPSITAPKVFTPGAGLTFKKSGGGQGPGGEKIEHRIGVQAPARVVWEVLADLDAWSEWNPLYTKVQGQLAIGGTLVLTLQLPDESPETIRPVVTDWTPDSLLHWKLTLAGGLVRSVRYLEIDELAEASCIFANGEIMGGLLGRYVAKRMGRKMYRGFEAMGEALKVRAEARWRLQGGNPTSAS